MRIRRHAIDGLFRHQVSRKKPRTRRPAFVDAYGSYLDIYKCLVIAGKLHSKLLVDKLVGVAKYDPQHREAMKALQKAKTILFYEPVSLLG